jgi:beta-lactamase class A
MTHREPKKSRGNHKRPHKGRTLPSALLLLAAACTPKGAQLRPPPAATAASSLEAELLSAVNAAGLDQVLDGRRGGARIAHTPNVDVAVIELDAAGRPVAAANVLLSRDYPSGAAVPVDPTTLGTRDVRFTRWDLERWDGQKPWGAAGPENDLLPGREGARLRFMAPYPASLFKLLIAYRVLRQVDRGALTLDERYRFLRDTVDKGERPVRGWLEPMVVESDNTSTEALVKLLHERGWMEGLNGELAELGLETLQVNGTSPVTGRSWSPGNIHMTALDTARLLLLLEGGPGVLWRTPSGREVTAAEMSNNARTVLKQLLADQGLHEALSSTLLCGDARAKPGIPAAVPARWVDATTGAATVAGTAFGRDTRPCNAAAEVDFLHKTGLTENYGSDGGIVRELPGKPKRRYIVVLLSNLGYRYYDEAVASFLDASKGDKGFPYAATGISYTQRLPALGRAIDELLKQRAEARE